MISKWEYYLLLLILLKNFKNASVDIIHFTELLYLKKDEFCTQKMNKKISKEAKRQGKIESSQEKSY